MAAYQERMSKLLWPERRLGIRSVKVTTEDSARPLPASEESRCGTRSARPRRIPARVPKGTPLNLLTNVNPRDAKSVSQAYIDGVLAGRPKSEFNQLQTIKHAKSHAAMLKRLLEVNTCPDFIEDKGDYYGHQLSDEDRRPD
jgi:hypothetical protein